MKRPIGLQQLDFPIKQTNDRFVHQHPTVEWSTNENVQDDWLSQAKNWLLDLLFEPADEFEAPEQTENQPAYRPVTKHDRPKFSETLRTLSVEKRGVIGKTGDKNSPLITKNRQVAGPLNQRLNTPANNQRIEQPSSTESPFRHVGFSPTLRQ